MPHPAVIEWAVFIDQGRWLRDPEASGTQISPRYSCEKDLVGLSVRGEFKGQTLGASRQGRKLWQLSTPPFPP